MSRPGFVLEVDERTPPLLMHQGEGFRLERLPLGHAGDLPAGLTAAAIRERRRRHPARAAQPARHRPLPELLTPGMRLTIVFDDLSLPLPQMRPRTSASGSSSRCWRWPRPGRRRRRRADRGQRAAPPDDAGRAEADRRRAGLPGVLPRPPEEPRRGGPGQPPPHGHHQARRGRGDQPAGRRERPDRLRQHHAHRDERRAQVGLGRAGALPEPQAPPQRAHAAALELLQRPAELRDAPLVRPDGRACSDEHVKVFTIETTLNNDTFPSPRWASSTSGSGSGTSATRRPIWRSSGPTS